MARFDRLTIYQTLIDEGLVPLFYNDDADVAFEVAKAVAKGGAHILEFTNRGDAAYDVFRVLIKRCAEEVPDMILGVGSVIDAPTAALYLAAGANFIVAPSTNPEVAKLCNRRKVGYIPGCGTATEVMHAEELGCEICKVFPGTAAGGPGFIKAVRAPSPWSRLMPTGGVAASLEDLSAWFDAGAACVGMGSKLVRKEWVTARDYDAITENVRQVRAWIKEAREK
jgi:2-dehydro-3-deoxyphosphogluconate aldolase/(4S)-4-hydroxy-2-oxoglutarate aldolase